MIFCPVLKDKVFVDLLIGSKLITENLNFTILIVIMTRRIFTCRLVADIINRIIKPSN